MSKQPQDVYELADQLTRVASRAALRMADLEKERDAFRYISVKDRLPEMHGESSPEWLFLTINKALVPRIAEWTPQGWACDWNVTHWAPLPPFPSLVTFDDELA